MLKAHVADPIQAWVQEKEAGIAGTVQSSDYMEDPPAPGMKAVEFLFYDLQDNCKVTVDSHSASPAFGEEARTLIFDLLKVGAIDQEQALEHLHPSGMDSMVEALQRKKAEQAAFAEAHPELAQEQAAKSHKRK